MDKLRKYIQECWGDIVYSDYDKVATLEDLEYNYRYIRFLLSTEAMFIKWLVENDKIDIDKLEKKVLKENLIKKKSFYATAMSTISPNWQWMIFNSFMASRFPI